MDASYFLVPLKNERLYVHKGIYAKVLEKHREIHISQAIPFIRRI